MEPTDNQWKVWLFVVCLNTIAVCGAYYLKTNGIDLYAFRGAS